MCRVTRSAPVFSNSEGFEYCHDKESIGSQKKPIPKPKRKPAKAEQVWKFTGQCCSAGYLLWNDTQGLEIVLQLMKDIPVTKTTGITELNSSFRF